MKCLICGRNLRNSNSVELGYGPVCYKKVFGVPASAAKTKSVAKQIKSGDIASGYNISGQISVDDYMKIIS